MFERGSGTESWVAMKAGVWRLFNVLPPWVYLRNPN